MRERLEKIASKLSSYKDFESDMKIIASGFGGAYSQLYTHKKATRQDKSRLNILRSNFIKITDEFHEYSRKFFE